MIALHESGQRIQKNFGPIERIHVQLGLVVRVHIVRIKYHRGDVEIVAFRTNALAIGERNRIADHDGADMALAKDVQRRVRRGHWYDPIARVSQNRVANGSQHPL
jgi:hypothetical protein